MALITHTRFEPAIHFKRRQPGRITVVASSSDDQGRAGEQVCRQEPAAHLPARRRRRRRHPPGAPAASGAWHARRVSPTWAGRGSAETEPARAGEGRLGHSPVAVTRTVTNSIGASGTA